MKKVLISMLQLHKNSGSARSAYEHLRYFKARGFEVHMVSANLDKDSVRDIGATPHTTIPWIKSTGYMRRRWYNWQVQRLAKSLKIDLLIGHGDIENQNLFYLHSAIFLNSELVNGRPVDPNYEMAKIHGKILSEQNFKMMVANSIQMKNDVVKRFRVPAEKIKVLYPSLNTNEFTPISASDKLKFKSQFKFPADKVVVGLITSGNLFKRGTDKFIEAISLLPEDIRKKAYFLIVGKDKFGPFEDQIKKANLQDQITYISHVSNVSDLYGATDIFVLPARFEEFGRSVLEAMGTGLPVVVSKFVGCHEIFSGENKDYVLHENSGAELAQKLQPLINDETLRSRLAKLNIQDAEQESEKKLYEKFDIAFAEWLK